MIHFHHDQQHVYRNSIDHSCCNNMKNQHQTVHIWVFYHQMIICNDSFYFSIFPSLFFNDIKLRRINPDKPKFCISIFVDSFNASSPRYPSS